MLLGIQRGGSGIAVPIFRLGARWGEGVTLRPLYPRHASVMFIVQEDGWAPRVGLVKY